MSEWDGGINPNDMYERIAPPFAMRKCACCGCEAELWKVRKDPECLRYAPGCSWAEELDEGMGILHGGCPLYDYLGESYETKRQAVQVWNAYNDKLEQLRNSRAPQAGMKH